MQSPDARSEDVFRSFFLCFRDGGQEERPQENSSGEFTATDVRIKYQCPVNGSVDLSTGWAHFGLPNPSKWREKSAAKER